MRQIFTVISILIVFFGITFVFAAGNETICRQWALEDGVPANKIANYTQKCVADQLNPPEPKVIQVNKENQQPLDL